MKKLSLILLAMAMAMAMAIAASLCATPAMADPPFLLPAVRLT